MLLQDDVLGHAKFLDRPVVHTLFRDVGQPGLRAFARRPSGDLVPAHPHHPAGDRSQPGHDFAQRPLSVAADPGHPQNLAAPHFQTGIVQRGVARDPQGADPLQGQKHLAHRHGGPVALQNHLPAHHHAGQLGTGHALGRNGTDQLAVAQYRHPVADVQDFVQFVADEDQAVAVLGHLAQGDKEVVHLLRGEYRGRFVQNQQGRPPIEGFHDLHPLPLAHSQGPHRGVGVDFETIRGGQLADTSGHSV